MTEFWVPGQCLTCLTLGWGLGGGQKGQAGASNDIPGDFSTQDRQAGWRAAGAQGPPCLPQDDPSLEWLGALCGGGEQMPADICSAPQCAYQPTEPQWTVLP